jgi:hypothetical protein
VNYRNIIFWHSTRNKKRGEIHMEELKKSLKKFLRKVVIVCVVVVALCLTGAKLVSVTMSLSEEELQQGITSNITQRVQTVFNEELHAQIESCQVEFSEFRRGQSPALSLEYWDAGFVAPGHADGDVDILIDYPALYPVLEKDDYQLEDLSALSDVTDPLESELWSNLYDAILVTVAKYRCELGLQFVFLDSKGNEYAVAYDRDVYGYASGIIKKNGEKVYSYYKAGNYGDYDGSGGSGSCPMCNGTGSVRYNYGSSDLEAILSGHDPYTYGPCTSCGGTGRG